MIVRDEASSLARAIASFAGVADEIVVVDTGSKDDSIAVGEGAGAKVVRHEWQESFALARNVGFDACTGDWIFVLDADERLLRESRDEVRRLVDTGTAQGYLVTRRDLTPSGYSEMRFMRLGKRGDQRLVGRIHEHFEPAWTDVKTSEILIEHDGYLGEKNAARLVRNVRLLDLELQDRPRQAYYLADLTHSLWLLRDPRWSFTLDEAFSVMDTTRPRPPHPLCLPLLEIVFATAEPLLPYGIDHALANGLAQRWYPESVPLLVARARIAFGMGDLVTATECGERAIGLWESSSYDRTVSFDPEIVGAELRLNLGVALAKLGRFKEAIARFEEVSSDPQFGSIALQNASAIKNAI